MVLFLVAHSLSELTYGCNKAARLLGILIGDVRTLSLTQARRITKQEIAFAVQVVNAILANDHARILTNNFSIPFKMPVLDYKIHNPLATCFYLRLSPIPSAENVVNLFL